MSILPFFQDYSLMVILIDLLFCFNLAKELARNMDEM